MIKIFPPLTATMCTYSFIAYAYPNGTDETDMKDRLNKLLNYEPIGLPKQELLWAAVTDVIMTEGAAAAADTSTDSNVALVYVCREAGSADYTVVVRGTNPFSWPSWKLEDLDAGSKVAWQSEFDPSADCGSISQATGTALATHLALNDGDQNLFDYLDSQLPFIKSLNFTGHSLGGCVSPVLALKYKEHLESNDFARPALSLYSYAGPSPGDAVFAKYMKKSFRDFAVVSFLRDKKDIVPHIWNLKNMSVIGQLYDLCPATSTVLSMLKFFNKRVENMDYKHAFPGFQPLILEELIIRIFGLDALEAAIDNDNLKPLIAAVTADLARNGIKVDDRDGGECGKTILWFLFAICMHVAPYLILCSGEAQEELLEKVIKPEYFQGILG